MALLGELKVYRHSIEYTPNSKLRRFNVTFDHSKTFYDVDNYKIVPGEDSFIVHELGANGKEIIKYEVTINHVDDYAITKDDMVTLKFSGYRVYEHNPTIKVIEPVPILIVGHNSALGVMYTVNIDLDNPNEKESEWLKDTETIMHLGVKYKRVDMNKLNITYFSPVQNLNTSKELNLIMIYTNKELPSENDMKEVVAIIKRYVGKE